MLLFLNPTTPAGTPTPSHQESTHAFPPDRHHRHARHARHPAPQGEDFATDKDTGAPLVVADVMVVLDGRAEMLQVTVPETGITKGIKPGATITFTALTASAWENTFNGQMRHGIAFRATALTAKAA
ncbi:hypothetical protein OG552_31190 [Streptomyces sp. NBC_01476]|uniref:SCO3933 family regulatory protein n=1 Tax=Streptomyces sp. NBC_01476 TaxID=2903881 RepID=UPI002E3655ED|nr:hypothetical protein [Streptomyces sp. NBC_01476]